MIVFEWHTAKAASNIKKHGVSFEEAQSVFFDEDAKQFFDNENSITEDRFLLLGMSNQRNLLLICHCVSCDGRNIRIISARKATKKEAKFYQPDNLRVH
ncbi:BrnT family toxin [Marinomonas agarivorans]|nr:BrnT family toxin [Marinomonas agarivorans]